MENSYTVLYVKLPKCVTRKSATLCYMLKSQNVFYV